MNQMNIYRNIFEKRATETETMQKQKPMQGPADTFARRFDTR